MSEQSIERCCGLDVHKRTVAACLRRRRPDGQMEEEVRNFGTTTPELLALRDWLQANEVTHVAMETKSVYWVPLYWVLAADFTLRLASAAEIEQVGGRTSDVSYCVWIARLLARGLFPNGAPPPKRQALDELEETLWVAQRPLRFLGLEIGTRMTVIRLADGGLFIHSPVPLGWQTRDELEELGPVHAVVAPNRFHHLSVKDFAAQYPDARLYAAPGLPEKRRDLTFHGTLTDTAEPLWAGQIEQLIFRPLPLFNEVVFFHPLSQTLILTDLALNMRSTASRYTRRVLQLDGVYGRFGVGRLDTWLVRDRAAARVLIDRMLAWDFDRIIVAHGEIVETGGKQALREAFDWL